MAADEWYSLPGWGLALWGSGFHCPGGDVFLMLLLCRHRRRDEFVCPSFPDMGEVLDRRKALKTCSSTDPEVLCKGIGHGPDPPASEGVEIRWLHQRMIENECPDPFPRPWNTIKIEKLNKHWKIFINSHLIKIYKTLNTSNRVWVSNGQIKLRSN